VQNDNDGQRRRPTAAGHSKNQNSGKDPPGSGAGKKPTTSMGNELVDAYLWVKTVGESDGQCNAAGGVRAWDYSVYTKPGWPTTAAGQAAFDLLWGRVDPAAGVWFPEQALELARLAVPAL